MNRCRYGVSNEEFESLLRKQDHSCAICNKRFENDERPYIDHDHASGWVRGLLCRDCNFAIGLLRDSVELTQRAVEYLIETATPTEFSLGAQRAAVRRSPSHHRRGVTLSEETRRLISVAKVGRSPAWNKGKPLSEAHKESLRKPKGTGRKFKKRLQWLDKTPLSPSKT
jgi:hypothetical protein